MNLNGSFGNWLRERRKALDLTQADLADQIGCSPNMIRKIEADERRPSKQISELMADVLAIAPEDRAAFISFARQATNAQSRLLDDLIPTVNLPAQPTPFIGREHELAHIAERLNDSVCRLLTLVGPGGIGKTRLALQAAADRVGEYADGVFFVSLTPVGATTLISSAIASALQISFYGQENPDAQLVNYLRRKHLLLVLDNYEHLLGGIGLLVDLLANAPRLKLLVTSRERLNMQEEWAMPVEGLPFPAQDINGNLSRYSAVQLFVQTALRIDQFFSLEGHEAAVADICRAVEGMPLGLELAATWLRVIPCSQIAGQIRRDLDFLATTLRNIEERHRSLRVVFEHSWSLLSVAERNVVMKLSVFRGGCDLEAAEQVAGASLRLVAGLVDKSLVRLNIAGRYDMHELLRQFAADKLLEYDQVDAARHRHLQHYLSLTEELEKQYFGPQHMAAMDRLGAEYDNCQAALDWALQAGDTESGLRLANALGWFWKLRGNRIEGIEWLNKFRVVSTTLPFLAQAKALLFRLELGSEIDDEERVKVLGAEAVTWIEKVEDSRLKAWLLLTAAYNAYYLEPRAQAYYEEALALFRGAGDQAGICKVLTLLSQRALQFGEFARVGELQAEAINLARQAVNKTALADLLMLAASKNWYQGKIDQETESLFHESLTLFRELRHKGGILMVLHVLGMFAWMRGESDRARELFVPSLQLAQEIGSITWIVRGLISLSEVFCEDGQSEQGARVLGAIGDAVLTEFSWPGFFAQEAVAGYERGVTAARSQLGETAFAAAFAEGKRMSLEQAVAYALSDATFAETV